MKAIILLLITLLSFAKSDADADIDQSWDCKGCVWYFRHSYRDFCAPNEIIQEYETNQDVFNSPPHPSYIAHCRKCIKKITPDDCEAYFKLVADEKREQDKINDCIEKCLMRMSLKKIDCVKICTPPKPMY